MGGRWLKGAEGICRTNGHNIIWGTSDGIHSTASPGNGECDSKHRRKCRDTRLAIDPEYGRHGVLSRCGETRHTRLDDWQSAEADHRSAWTHIAWIDEFGLSSPICCARSVFELFKELSSFGTTTCGTIAKQQAWTYIGRDPHPTRRCQDFRLFSPPSLIQGLPGQLRWTPLEVARASIPPRTLDECIGESPES